MYACIRKTAGGFFVGVCEQEHQGSEIGAAYPSAGCSTVAVSWAKRDPDSPLCLHVFPTNHDKSREPTRGLEPLACSLRVIIHTLQGFARACKSPISRPVSFPFLAQYCTVLHSRWCQSGVNIAARLSSYSGPGLPARPCVRLKWRGSPDSVAQPERLGLHRGPSALLRREREFPLTSYAEDGERRIASYAGPFVTECPWVPRSAAGRAYEAGHCLVQTPDRRERYALSNS